MERKVNLLYVSLAVAGLSMTMAHCNPENNPAEVQTAEAATLDDYTPPPTLDFYPGKLNLADMISIPHFFEGCEILPQGWIGRGSVYTEAGCEGCSENQTMANGEKLSDNKPTFASWRGRLNSFWLLKNKVTGLWAKGKLTDRGNFDRLANPHPEYIINGEMGERTFDLSLSLSRKLGDIKTSENTPVDINLLDCS